MIYFFLFDFDWMIVLSNLEATPVANVECAMAFLEYLGAKRRSLE